MRCHFIFHRAGLHARDVEEITDHGCKPLGAGVAQAQKTLLLVVERSRNFLKKQMHDLAHRRQRRFEIVRDMRNEILLHLVEFAEPFRHDIEIAGDFRKFVVAVSRQAVPELSLCNGASPLREPAQWLVNRADDHGSDNQAKNEREDSGGP